MATQIRAIETVYDGYRFRSRLEARWAVFFNALGIEYEYEKEGFDLSGYRMLDRDPNGELGARLGWYLPDFWLPIQKCWIEVKGRCPTDVEKATSAGLARMTGHRAFVQFAPVPFPHPGAVNSDAALGPGAWRYWWCQCPVCDSFGLAVDGYPQHLDCECVADGHSRQCRPTYDAPRIVAAYSVARQARFEHGESPGGRA